MGWGRWVGVAAMGAAIVACGGSGTSEVQQGASVTPTLVLGNPTCPAGQTSLKLEGGDLVDGTYTDGDLIVTVDFHGAFVDFTANQGVDRVIVKGGPNANVYIYSPEVTSDTNLTTPTNPNNGQPYGFSHVDFCYDEEDEEDALEVTKTAVTHRHRGYTWDIDKEGECPVLGPLPLGWTWELWFTVTLTPAFVDAWITEGTILIHNPAPVAATITDVIDELDGAEVDDLDCGVTFPYVLAAGATLQCTYSDTSATAPEENQVVVTTSGPVAGGSDTVEVVVGEDTEGDECVTIEDSLAGDLGEVCVGGDLTIEYGYVIGPFEVCECIDIDNTATFTTNDTETTGSDTFTTKVEICEDQPGYEDPPEYTPLSTASISTAALSTELYGSCRPQ